jgi:hypothetical protein
MAKSSADQSQFLTQGEKALSQRDKLILATRQSVAAQLAAALIACDGRPHSVEDALVVFTDVLFTLYPQSGQEKYETWVRGKRSHRTAPSLIDTQERLSAAE